MYVPLGVLRPLAFDGSLFERRRASVESSRGAAAARCGARAVRRRVGARRASSARAGAPPGSIRCSNRPSAPPPPTGLETRSAAAASPSSSSSCELGQHPIARLARNVLRRRRRAAGALDRRQQSPRADDSEAVRRVGDRLPAQRGSQGRGGRIGASGDVGVDAATAPTAAAGLRSRPALGGLPRRGSAGPAPGAASACARRRAPGFRLRAATPARRAPRPAPRAVAVDVDEDRSPVGPGRLTGLAGRHPQGAAGDRRGEQAESLQGCRRGARHR